MPTASHCQDKSTLSDIFSQFFECGSEASAFADKTQPPKLPNALLPPSLLPSKQHILRRLALPLTLLHIQHQIILQHVFLRRIPQLLRCTVNRRRIPFQLHKRPNRRLVHFNQQTLRPSMTPRQHIRRPILLVPEPAPQPQPLKNPLHRSPVRQLRCRDRKSTRLNSSHANISYAVFCLKKKKKRT